MNLQNGVKKTVFPILNIDKYVTIICEWPCNMLWGIAIGKNPEKFKSDSTKTNWIFSIQLREIQNYLNFMEKLKPQWCFSRFFDCDVTRVWRLSWATDSLRQWKFAGICIFISKFASFSWSYMSTGHAVSWRLSNYSFYFVSLFYVYLFLSYLLL